MPGVENLSSCMIGPYTSAVSYPIKGGFNHSEDTLWGSIILYNHAPPGVQRAVYHSEGMACTMDSIRSC